MNSEAALLEQLRARVGTLPDDMVVAGDQDAALRRFLVARKWDVDLAEAQLRRTLAWRADEFRVQDVLAAPPLQRLSLVRALLPSNPHVGFTPAGIPVSLISLGTADLVASARELTPQDVATDFVVRAEFYRDLVFPEASRRAGVTVDKEVLLLDLGGASMSLLKVMHLFKELNRIGSSYFPERTLNILVLNAPRVFSTVWSMVKGLVDPRTQKKVHILSGGASQMKVLRTFLADADIPACLGGARAPPCVSGPDKLITAKIYARMDSWLVQRGASAITSASDARPQSVLEPPMDVAPALAGRAAAQELRRTRSAPRPLGAGGRRSEDGGKAWSPQTPPVPDAAAPSLTSPLRLSRSSSLRLATTAGATEAAEPAAAPEGALRNALVLGVLWLASSLLFALVAWARLAGLEGELYRRRKVQ